MQYVLALLVAFPLLRNAQSAATFVARLAALDRVRQLRRWASPTHSDPSSGGYILTLMKQRKLHAQEVRVFFALIPELVMGLVSARTLALLVRFRRLLAVSLRDSPMHPLTQGEMLAFKDEYANVWEDVFRLLHLRDLGAIKMHSFWEWPSTGKGRLIVLFLCIYLL